MAISRLNIETQKTHTHPDYDFASIDLLLKQHHSLPQHGEYGEMNRDLVTKETNIFDQKLYNHKILKHYTQKRRKDSIRTHQLHTIESVQTFH